MPVLACILLFASACVMLWCIMNVPDNPTKRRFDEAVNRGVPKPMPLRTPVPQQQWTNKTTTTKITSSHADSLDVIYAELDKLTKELKEQQEQRAKIEAEKAALALIDDICPECEKPFSMEDDYMCSDCRKKMG